MVSLEGKTLIMSGGSRGIGLAIALRAARDGANIAMLAKTDTPNPKLPGTVFSAASEIEAAGGQALPIVGDVRSDESVAAAVHRTVDEFGGIDIVVNNASAIDLSTTDEISMKRYDLMQDINCRGSFLLSKMALPHLQASAKAGRGPHILTLSPPLNLNPAWAGKHLGYTIAKYGMSLTTLGLAEELKGNGISVNSLWPRTLIATAAVQNVLGGDTSIAVSRKPEIMADAAYLILNTAETANFFIDDAVLAMHGTTDFEHYRTAPGDGELELDIFLDPAVG
nr:NAD(P)-dependent oxidoreductase [Hoyosella subflava]